MLTLNLISQNLKKEIKLRRLYKLLKNMNYVLILIILSSTIILVTAKIFLQNSFNEIIEQTTLVTKNTQTYNTKVREVNQKINAISAMQNDHIRWSILIEELATITPDDLTFSIIKIEKGKINMKGSAGTRDGLLLFRDQLEASELFSNIQLPIKNILNKTDITFDVSADINKEKISI